MAIAGAHRKQVLKVLMISLLLDLVRLNFNLTSHVSSPKANNSPDLLHLHPAALPVSTLLLPRPRPLSFLTPEPHLPLPKRLQERLRPPHRLPL